jgi:PAS domain S-box-containing protein
MQIRIQQDSGENSSVSSGVTPPQSASGPGTLTESRVRTQEEQLRSIIDTIPALAWTARPDGSAEFFNRRWLDYAGLSIEEARNWGWTAAVHADDLTRLADYWRSVLPSGEPGEIEARLRRFDGEYRWFLFRASPLRDESGRIIRWYGTNTDIEGLKRTEDVLRLSERSSRLIVDSVPGLVCTMSASGELEQVNRQILEYFGKTFEELRDWAMSDAVHPADLPGITAAWTRSLETGERTTLNTVSAAPMANTSGSSLAVSRCGVRTIESSAGIYCSRISMSASAQRHY